jgi:hypothetical protein
MEPNNTPSRFRIKALSAGLCCSVLVACASTPPPRERLVLAEAAVDAAVSAGAQELAPTELAQARKALEAARLAVAREENAKALVMAERAEVDGLVARNKASAERSRRAYEEVQNGLKALREQSRPSTR